MVSLGGAICGSIDDIEWIVNVTHDGVPEPSSYYLSFYPSDLLGPRIAISAESDPGDVVVVAHFTPYRGGIPIGPTATLTLT